jgi:hypothetical protein
MAGYVLDPARPVLLRPDGVVQVGWDPRRAVLVRPPTGMTARTLADLLRRLQSGATLAQLDEHADGIGTHVVAELVSSLVDAAVVTSTAPRRTRAASIRIHGRGPLSDLLASALRCSGALITQSSRTHAGAPADLAVLADFLVSDPRVVRDLHADGVPYLPVRVRDGIGLVGPLVLPGVTSCLECADLHRSDRDSSWPAVAAQLRDTVGSADRATVLATAALALNQVECVVRAVHGGLDMADTAEPPSTLNTTLEFDVNVGTIAARHWPKHPRCGC